MQQECQSHYHAALSVMPPARPEWTSRVTDEVQTIVLRGAQVRTSTTRDSSSGPNRPASRARTSGVNIAAGDTSNSLFGIDLGGWDDPGHTSKGNIGFDRAAIYASGVNASTMKSQWQIQVGACTPGSW
jgi:hypothetical protein